MRKLRNRNSSMLTGEFVESLPIRDESCLHASLTAESMSPYHRAWPWPLVSLGTYFR